jgi:hypothetical protein
MHLPLWTDGPGKTWVEPTQKSPRLKFNFSETCSILSEMAVTRSRSLEAHEKMKSSFLTPTAPLCIRKDWC